MKKVVENFKVFGGSGAIVNNLIKNKYVHIPSESITISANDLNEWVNLKISWENLSHDSYMKNGDSYRKRAFGKFTLNIESDDLRPLEDCVFFQSNEINTYAGGVMRILPGMSDEVKLNRVLHQLVKNSLEMFLSYKPSNVKNWSIFAHQFRINANAGVKGHPTPEGIHKDGHKFISMHMIDRKNIEGGTSYILDHEKKVKYEVTLKAPLESILLDDMEMHHYVSPVALKGSDFGFRDVLIIDYNEIKNENSDNGSAYGSK